MIRWRRGRVMGLARRWSGVQVVQVRDDEGIERPSLAYLSLVGDLAVGDEVLLNVSAYERRLGTGGYAIVVSPISPPADRRDHECPGHLVKARYTPSQAMVLGVDEQESPHHDLLREADSLDRLPVVVADLHSSLPAVIAGARQAAATAGAPPPRVAYVMTDGGALPAWFSRTVARLTEADWLAGTITSGQSFGGDLEAVTVHSALLAAHLVLRADLVIVTQGPGNLGTGTRWGFSGVSAGEAINATATLAGRPVAALRVSGADPRPRHQGLSHHSLTSFGRVALAAAEVVVPYPTPDLAAQYEGLADLAVRVQHEAAVLATSPAGHDLHAVPVDDAVMQALRRSPAPLSTMGRGIEDDPLAFLAAAAAGRHAVQPRP